MLGHEALVSLIPQTEADAQHIEHRGCFRQISSHLSRHQTATRCVSWTFLVVLAHIPELIELEALAAIIPKLFSFTNYGFRLEDFPSSSSKKLPVALQIPRWEVTDLAAHFPAEQLDALRTRQTVRRRAREECIRILADMDDVERIEVLKGDKGDREKPTAREKSNAGDELSLPPQSSQPEPVEREDTPRSRREGTAATSTSRRSVSPQRKKLSSEEEEARRIKYEEREARKAAQAEKKA